MNRDQRRPWVALAGGSGYTVCSYCRHANWIVDDLMCEHPLDAVNDRYGGTGPEPGDDCFGFRPKKGETLEAAAARMAEATP